MPPKRRSPNGGKPYVASEKEKGALCRMFKRVESSDERMETCNLCQMQMKLCLMKDHLEFKCENRMKNMVKQELEQLMMSQKRGDVKKRPVDEVIVIDDDDDDDKNDESKVTLSDESKKDAEESECKKIKTEPAEEDKVSSNVVEINSRSNSSDDTNALNELMDKYEEMSGASQTTSQQNSAATSSFDFYLSNFTNALDAVLSQETFRCLLDQADYDIVEKFSSLSGN
jgi:hypothetical protein